MGENQNNNIIGTVVEEATLTEITEELKILIQNNIISPVGSYLKEAENLYKKFLDKYNEVFRSDRNHRDIFIDMYSFARSQTTLQKVMVEGYILLETIRTMFVGKENETSYMLGFSFYHEQYTTQMDLSELSQYLHWSIDWTSLLPKLRLNLRRNEIITNKTLTSMKGTVNEKLFNKVLQYFRNPESGVKVGNWGNFFETYVLLNSEGKMNPNKATIRHAFETVLKNNIKGLQGGDVGNLQVKYYGASVVDFSFIIKNLRDIYNNCLSFINGGNVKTLYNALKQKFTKDKTKIGNLGTAAAEKIANKAIIEYLRKAFASNPNIHINTS